MKGLRRKIAVGEHSVNTRIEGVLGDLAPLLRIEHCRLQVEEFVVSSGHVTIRIEGTCPDCLGSPAMFATAIEAHVRQRVPEVRAISILG